MALTLRKDSKWWYGEFVLNGHRRVIKLGVSIPVKSIRPTSLRLRGDDAFERSRTKALQAFEEAKREVTDPAKAADRLKRIHEIQLGSTIEKLDIPDLVRLWRECPAEKTPGKDRATWAKLILERFAAYMQKFYPHIHDVRLITTGMILGFMNEQERRGISHSTYNSSRSVLSKAFNGARRSGGLISNPVTDVPAKRDNSVHKKPLSISQVAAIMEAAKNDSIAGPIIITALCTGMRRSNCALLTWSDVDLEKNLLNVTILKTGVQVFIPILPHLKKLLENSPRVGKYCFPDAAKDVISRNKTSYNRLRILLAAVGVDYDEVDVTTGPRLIKASQHGFHALKTTFITMALNAGFPMELLKKIVGNQAVEIVRKRYYQPDQEEMRSKMMAKLPRELTGVVSDEISLVTRVEWLLTKTRSLTPDNLSELQKTMEAELIVVRNEIERRD